MKIYQKPEAEYIRFTSEAITDSVPGVEGGDTSNILGEEFE